MRDAWRLALGTLTILPTRTGTVDRRTAGHAMELAPLVGLLIGLLAGVVLYGSRVTLGSPYLPPVLGIASLAWLTRGLHLDGLADLADGLGARKDPEGTRAVMKDPSVGAFGVLWLVFVPLVQVAALLTCVNQGRGTASLMLAVFTGRLALTAACRSTPSATDTGLGAMVAGTVRRGITSAWLLLVLAFAGYALYDHDAIGNDSFRVIRTLAAPLIALWVVRSVRQRAVRRVGGLTGDVLGALCELATTVCLLVLALPGNHDHPL
ncbi:MAG: cobS [Frankiales bacterium]|nr:cobS [Frankiales bacterium]